MVDLQQYYKTKHWRNLSSSILDNKDCECQLCHRKRWKYITRGKNKNKWKRMLRFALHHVTYDYIYKEQEHPECLLTLCSTCHNFCHDALRYRNLSSMYSEVALVVEKHGFIYTKESTS